MKNLPDKKPSPRRRVSVVRAFWSRALNMMRPGNKERNKPEIERLMARDVVQAKMLRDRQKKARIAITNDAKRTSEFNRYTKYLAKEKKQFRRCEVALSRLQGSKARPNRFERLRRHELHHASEVERVKRILFAELVTPDSSTA